MAQGYKTFSCSTQLSIKFIMLINVKMTTIVGILIFMSMMNTSEHLKARKVFIFKQFRFYEHLKFHAQGQKGILVTLPLVNAQKFPKS